MKKSRWRKRDKMTPEQRSFCMSRVRSKDTDIEKLVRSSLYRDGLRFKKHVATMPGKPDIVFPEAKVVVLIDGNFWHGYRFPAWQHKVSKFWKDKIVGNRKRDQRNFRILRRQGWKVIRLWEKQLRRDFEGILMRVKEEVLLRADLQTKLGNR